jgi:hypothetical protein
MKTTTVYIPNKIKCKICKTIIHSRHRHDFIWCICGNVFVDGGDDYKKFGGKDFSNILILDSSLKNPNKLVYKNYKTYKERK